MFSAVAINFVATCLEFLLLHFTIPYLAGSGLQKLSKNVIWEYIYYAISGIGHLIYKVIEIVFNFIILNILRIISGKEIRPDSLVALFTNFLVYFIFLYYLESLNSAMIYDIFGLANFDIDYGNTVKGFSIVENFGAIFLFFGTLFSSGSIIGFFVTLFNNIFAILLFLVYSTVHFSIIYGILENKMYDLNLLSGGEREEHRRNVMDLSRELKYNIYEFIDDLSIMKHLLIKRVLFTCSIIALLYSYELYRLYDNYTIGDIIYTLLIESNVLDTIVMFLIVIVFNLLLQVCFILYVNLRSERFRERVIEFGRIAMERMDDMRERRRAWSEEHDFMYRLVGDFNRNRRDSGDIDDMNLE